MGVKIALLHYTRGEDGRLFITPECTSFEEIEGQINSLQDALDEIRESSARLPGHLKSTSWDHVPRRAAELPLRARA